MVLQHKWMHLSTLFLLSASALVWLYLAWARQGSMNYLVAGVLVVLSLTYLPLVRAVQRPRYGASYEEVKRWRSK